MGFKHFPLEFNGNFTDKEISAVRNDEIFNCISEMKKVIFDFYNEEWQRDVLFNIL